MVSNVFSFSKQIWGSELPLSNQIKDHSKTLLVQYFVEMRKWYLRKSSVAFGCLKVRFRDANAGLCIWPDYVPCNRSYSWLGAHRDFTVHELNYTVKPLLKILTYVLARFHSMLCNHRWRLHKLGLVCAFNKTLKSSHPSNKHVHTVKPRYNETGYNELMDITKQS